MKKLLTAVMAGLLVFALSACSNNGGDEVIVKTDAGNVTKSEFYKQLKQTAGKQVLQQMVYEKILDKKYDVSEKLEKEFNKYKDQQGDQFETWLHSQGFQNEEQFKQQLKLSLLIEKARMDGVKITEDEMKEYYDKHKVDQFTELKVSHILVKEESKAELIEQKLKNGADFAELAKKYSEDPGSAKDGGNVGYVTKNSQMVKPFLDAAFKLDVGEVSKPVKSQFGYHIIKVTDKKVKSFKEVKDQIKQTLKQQQAKPLEEVLSELNKEGNIKVKDDDFKDLFKVEKTDEKDKKSDSK
ncbi:MAG TPA: peptidylprolyl isomerase [Bacillales bacterium]|nr:peptidylprolyl isomerase [Bacillales bacterium]